MAAKSAGRGSNTWWVPLFGWSSKPNYNDNLVTQEASEKGAAVETKGKSKRSTDLKGHVVEEGEAEASEVRGDVVGVSVTGPRNGCFETGDAAGGFTSGRDEEGKDNDVDTDVEWDPNLWILEGERRWRQKNSRGVGDGMTAMLERQAMNGRVWSATEERQ
ncbi:hypothetical protein BHE74_00043582 [Ensete ventricosum]|nr:hypothetical protein BHE74_00043582 [Ensete ventricosum]RZS01796.1 hypothetical protein BHM03_00031728 [Ensete ventricosum]